MIYYSAVPVHMDSVDGEQYEKLRALKEDLRSRGLFDEYGDLTTFRTKFARHLAQRVIASFASGEHAGELDRPPPAERQPDLSEAALDLLLEAVQGPAGVIMRLGTMGGRTSRRTNAASWSRAMSDPLHDGEVRSMTCITWGLSRTAPERERSSSSPMPDTGSAIFSELSSPCLTSRFTSLSAPRSAGESGR